MLENSSDNKSLKFLKANQKEKKNVSQWGCFQWAEDHAFQFKPPAGGPVPKPWTWKTGKGKDGEGGGPGVLVGNGAWSTPSCSAEQLLWLSLPLRYCCAKRAPIRQQNKKKKRRLTHELKASKFLFFHLLDASLGFNQSQKGPRGGWGSRSGKWGRGHWGVAGESIFCAPDWKWCLNHHVSSRCVWSKCKRSNLNPE